MKKIFVILAALTSLLGLAHIAAATDYRYVSAETLKTWLEAARPVLLVDIQEGKDFAAHHIKGSVETNGYPVKTEEDRRRLEPALQKIKGTAYEAIVVVCPRGKGGARRTYDYLAAQNAPATLYILTGGMEKWPYREWVETR